MTASRKFDRKVIPSDLFSQLEKFSPSLQLLFVKLWAKSDYAGILNWSEAQQIAKELKLLYLYSSSLPRFNEMILVIDQKVILKDYLFYNYGKELKPKYNPHAKAWSAIDLHHLEYDPVTNSLESSKKKNR